MANRVPLIINTTANQIQELALGDCLDLTASGIHNAGVITATKFVGDGSLLTNVSGGGGGGISDIVEDTTPQLGGNLDINGKIINGTGSIVITGGIQATSFTGSVVGDVTGNVSGSAGSASGLTGNPAIQVASVVATGHIQADTVSVASTLTYEDVTNIDSIGIVTARTGIKVLAGGIDAVGTITATAFSGDGSGLTNVGGGLQNIVEDTTPQLGGDLDTNGHNITTPADTYISSSAGNLYVGGNTNLDLQAGGSTIVQLGSASAGIFEHIWLYNQKHLNIQGGSLKIINGGNIELTGGGGIKDKDGDLGTSGQVLSSTGTQINWIDPPTPSYNDDVKFILGTDSDLEIYHSGNENYIKDAGNAGSGAGTIIVDGSNGVKLRSEGTDVLHADTNQLKFYTDLYIFNGKNFTMQGAGSTFSTDGDILDSKGNLRQMPINFHNASTYTLVASDAGKVVSEATMGATITVPASTFVGGDAVTLMNHTGNVHTIDCSAITMYLSGDTSPKTSLTLDGRGLATIFFREHNVAYISGAGLS